MIDRAEYARVQQGGPASQAMDSVVQASLAAHARRGKGVDFAEIGLRDGVSMPTNILDVVGAQRKGAAPCVLCGGSVGSHSCLSCAGVFCASCCFSGTKSYDETR